VNTGIRRAQTQRVIDGDPSTIVVVRNERNSDDVPVQTTWEFTGRVSASGPYRGMEAWPRGAMRVEHAVGQINHCILAAWDETALKTGDLVTCTNDGTPTVVKKFRVVTCSMYPFKLEATCNESQ
jgi:hypothetical protein